jgi:hypothetical protein
MPEKQKVNPGRDRHKPAGHGSSSGCFGAGRAESRAYIQYSFEIQIETDRNHRAMPVLQAALEIGGPQIFGREVEVLSRPSRDIG